MTTTTQKKIPLRTSVKRMLADVYTPVGIYLRLRDRFRDTVLLESADHHASENSYSFICIGAIGGIELGHDRSCEWKLPGRPAEKRQLAAGEGLDETLWEFMQRFAPDAQAEEGARFAQGLYGYLSWDAIPNLEKITFRQRNEEAPMPLARYRLYQYVIAINHHRDELILCENEVGGLESELGLVESLIRNRDVPTYPFRAQGGETSNMADSTYIEMVEGGIRNCLRGDVFQIVLSRRFEQPFTGDDFNVYRALRHINPSPYLFYFDYGDYRLMGSSPESQLILSGGKAVVHPIAGTFPRTGDEEADRKSAEALMADAKENAEHVMLVDLARNDLSTVCSGVGVSRYRQVQYYSHVIHLVSEVTGNVPGNTNPFTVLFRTYPAGTLSGAPKHKAMSLIDAAEPTARGFYGGAIGFIGMDGSCNHAIMIRTVLSAGNRLRYQAGAGVVAASKPASELQEVNNKLNAIRKAIALAGRLEG